MKNETLPQYEIEQKKLKIEMEKYNEAIEKYCNGLELLSEELTKIEAVQATQQETFNNILTSFNNIFSACSDLSEEKGDENIFNYLLIGAYSDKHNRDVVSKIMQSKKKLEKCGNCNGDGICAVPTPSGDDCNMEQCDMCDSRGYFISDNSIVH